jgi:modulator of FtsH protease
MTALVSCSTVGTEVSNLIKNTYALLSATLLFTAAVSWAAMDLHLGGWACLGFVIGSFALISGIYKARNSALGILGLFIFAGLQGAGLGPAIASVLKTPHGSEAVAMASFLTASVFVGLSAYVHVTKKDFSAWGGMLFAGLLVVVVASLVGRCIPSGAYHVTISAVSALVFCGYILYDTSRIVTGGETNYVMATLQLYLDGLNLFLDLLDLLDWTEGD